MRSGCRVRDLTTSGCAARYTHDDVCVLHNDSAGGMLDEFQRTTSVETGRGIQKFCDRTKPVMRVGSENDQGEISEYDGDTGSPMVR